MDEMRGYCIMWVHVHYSLSLLFKNFYHCQHGCHLEQKQAIM